MDRLKGSLDSTVRATITLRDTQDAVITTFTGTETLSLAVWSGEDQKAITLSTATVEWLVAASGTISLSVPLDATKLEEGTYRLRIRITSGSIVLDAYEAWLEVTASPGSVDPPLTYCSYKDVKDLLASTIGLLQEEDDLAGFADAREDARNQFDLLLQRHYRGDRGQRRQNSLDYRLDGLRRPWRSGKDSSTLQTWLDAGGLILTTPTGKSIRQWNALWAAAKVLERQIGQSKDSPYQALAKSYQQQCETIAACLTVEVDTNDDGVGDITIDLGVADTLRS